MNPKHAITVWKRDRLGTAWAWSCHCGRRYDTDQPTDKAARDQANAHVATAGRGAA